MPVPATATDGLAGAAPAVKVWRLGTHRTRSPAETVTVVQPCLHAAGITRVANVTGLDTIGIPVVMVVRPNARSLSVSQGKGLDLNAARASGIMESLELHVAEHADLPVRVASTRSLRGEEPLVDVDRLPRPAWSRYHETLEMAWVEARDLVGGGPVWIPYETVHTDYCPSSSPGSGSFAKTSNGLASGNCFTEALAHALCEVLERDAVTLLHAAGSASRSRRRIDLASVDDPLCNEALERFERADVSVAAWDATSDVGIPCIIAAVADRDPSRFRRVPPARGAGCHPDRGVALLRALTEAAQCRLTVIAGSRDDHLPSGYERLRDRETDATVPGPGEPRRAPDVSFTGLPTFCHETVDGDLALLVERLRSVGVRQAAVVELTPPGLPVAVVRVVIPGLEGMGDTVGYVPGTRARKAAGNRR